jgi:hypothetical protein
VLLLKEIRKDVLQVKQTTQNKNRCEVYNPHILWLFEELSSSHLKETSTAFSLSRLGAFSSLAFESLIISMLLLIPDVC